MTQDEIDLDDLLVIRHLSPRKSGETLCDVVNRIINWEITIAFDPAVSAEARALIEKGREFVGSPRAWLLEWPPSEGKTSERLYDDERHCLLDAQENGGTCRPLYVVE